MVAGVAEHVECDAKAIEFGGLAQLGEHLLCKQGVVGSIPSSSTTYELSLFRCLKRQKVGVPELSEWGTTGLGLAAWNM